MSSHDGHPGNPPPQPEAGRGADYGDSNVGSLRLSGYDWTDVVALEPAVGRRVVFLVLRQGSATVGRNRRRGRDGAVRGRAEPGVGGGAAVRRPRRLAAPGARPGHHPACVRRFTPQAVANLPISVDDAARSVEDVARAKDAGEQLVHVGQDKRLDYREIDLRTPANQAIFRVQCQVENIFRQVLLPEGFVGIHTLKLIAGSSEGGAAVFNLDYNGQPACLAQSPQLHKQMAVCGEFERVFEIEQCLNAFSPNTSCKNLETSKEVCDVVDRLFVAMFDHLNKNCAKELEAIHWQYPLKPLKYLGKTLRIDHDEGIRMLKEARVHVKLMGDLSRG